MSAQDRLNEFIQLDAEKTNAQIEVSNLKRLLASSQEELEGKKQIINDAFDRIEEYRIALMELYMEIPMASRKKVEVKIKRLME